MADAASGRYGVALAFRLRRFALVIAAAALPGCVIEHVPVVAATTDRALVGRIELVVPRSDSGMQLAAVTDLPWSHLRLTLAPRDRSGPTQVYTFDAHDVGLRPAAPMGYLPPGDYGVDAELLADLRGGSQMVVATGQLDGDQAARLQAGTNALQIMVHPAMVGTHVALAPTSIDPPDDEESSTPTTSSDGEDVVAQATLPITDFSTINGDGTPSSEVPSSDPATDPPAPTTPQADSGSPDESAFGSDSSSDAGVDDSWSGDAGSSDDQSDNSDQGDENQ